MRSENPEAAIAAQEEWRRKIFDRFRNQYDIFVGQAKGFLTNDTAITRDALKQGIEAERFLSENDEEGPISENDAIYQAKRNTNLRNSDLADIYKSDGKLADIYRRISGRTSFMRNKHSDMSSTVPHSIKREMISAQVDQLNKFAKLYGEVGLRKNKAEDPDGKIAALEKETRERLDPIAEKADPYILADMTVAINHALEYQKLRREFLRVGGVGETDMNLKGEWASLAVRRILSDIHSDEYNAELRGYLADDTRDLDKQKRNNLIQSGTAIDDEFSGRSVK